MAQGLQSNPAVWRVPATGLAEAKLAGPCEISGLSLKGGSGAGLISLYDGTDASAKNDTNLKWVLDASISGVDNQPFPLPIVFKKGIYAVCEQGQANNVILCFCATNYLA